jgi:hypothetical protein
MTGQPNMAVRRGLTRANLHGVWAAIATPFDENHHFDEGVLRENTRRPRACPN